MGQTQRGRLAAGPCEGGSRGFLREGCRCPSPLAAGLSPPTLKREAWPSPVLPWGLPDTKERALLQALGVGGSCQHCVGKGRGEGRALCVTRSDCWRGSGLGERGRAGGDVVGGCDSAPGERR